MTLITWLSQMEMVFGTDFWNHVLIVTTHWSYNAHHVKLRLSHDPPHTEEQWINQTRAFLTKHFKINIEIPVLFIDSHFDQTDDSENKHFTDHMIKLYFILKKANNRFMFKNVTVVKSELLQLQHKFKNLTDDNNSLQFKHKSILADHKNLTVLLHNASSILNISLLNNTHLNNIIKEAPFENMKLVFWSSLASGMLMLCALLFLSGIYYCSSKIEYGNVTIEPEEIEMTDIVAGSDNEHSTSDTDSNATDNDIDKYVDHFSCDCPCM